MFEIFSDSVKVGLKLAANHIFLTNTVTTATRIVPPLPLRVSIAAFSNMSNKTSESHRWCMRIPWIFMQTTNQPDCIYLSPKNFSRLIRVCAELSPAAIALLCPLFSSLFMKNLVLLASCFSLFLTDCQSDSKENSIPAKVKTGIWRAVIQSPGGELPFGLDIARQNDSTFTVYAINGQERLLMDDAHLQGDSLRIPMRMFDAEIIAKAQDSVLAGYYRKQATGRTVQLDFAAAQGPTYRFAPSRAGASVNMTGKWDVTFYGEKDSSRAVGVFGQDGNELTGTFLTPTGDYRYLAGSVEGDRFSLSCFDGTNLYLFKGSVDTATRQISGEFWSGDRGYRKWTAMRNDKAALPDANTFTMLKKGYDAVSFSFPDPSGKQISLNDAKYKGKVVIVQILGSWCPNCMDETNFLAPWYDKNKSRGVEIIGLAFEKSNDIAVSGPKIERMKQRFNMRYDVLLAGLNDSTASRSLPMLEKIKGYPTTIFIDRKGEVRRIHTGFSGPGTGKYYDEFTEEFNLFTDKLLAEK